MAASLSVRETKGSLTATLESAVVLKSGAKSSRWMTRMRFDADSSFEPMVERGNPIVAGHVERTLSQVQEVALDSRVLRRASPPLRRLRPTPDQSLPWLVLHLKRYQRLFRAWKKHLRTAISDFQDVRVNRRKDDEHAYLVVIFNGGVEVPSWALSDGTLHMLALTIIAYLPAEGHTYLIEEPEKRCSSAGCRIDLSLAFVGLWRSSADHDPFPRPLGLYRAQGTAVLLQA